VSIHTTLTYPKTHRLAGKEGKEREKSDNGYDKAKALRNVCVCVCVQTKHVFSVMQLQQLASEKSGRGEPSLPPSSVLSPSLSLSLRISPRSPVHHELKHLRVHLGHRHEARHAKHLLHTSRTCVPEKLPGSAGVQVVCVRQRLR
jgi:hypothetical protein